MEVRLPRIWRLFGKCRMISHKKYPGMSRQHAKNLAMANIKNDADLARIDEGEDGIRSLAESTGIDPEELQNWADVSQREAFVPFRQRVRQWVIPSSWIITKWATATVAGVLLGAIATSFYHRAVPEVQVKSVNITTAYNNLFKSDEIVEVPRGEFIERMNSHTWTTSVRKSATRLSEIIEVLKSNKESLDLIIEQIQGVRQDYGAMKLLLSNPPTKTVAESFFDLWEKNDSLIHGIIRGNYQRSGFNLPNSSEFYLQEPDDIYPEQRRHLIIRDLSDDIAFGVVGTSKIGGFYNSFLSPDFTADIPLNRAVAFSLAYFDQKFLQLFLSQVEPEVRNLQINKVLREDIQLHLNGFSRWTLAVVLVNNGSSPVSFSGKARLYINTKGVSGFGERYADIELEHRNAQGDLAPITVNGSEAIVANFISPALISEDARWKDILKLYTTGSREAMLMVTAEPATWFRQSQIESSVFDFARSSQTPYPSVEMLDAFFGSAK